MDRAQVSGLSQQRGAGPKAVADRGIEMLGIRVLAMTRAQLTSLVVQEVYRAQRAVIAHHNLHSAALTRHDAKLRDFYQRVHYAHADGMSLIVVARLLGLPLTSSHRTTYVDWLPDLLAEGQQRQWRLFYLGSSPESLTLGLQRVRSAFPGLQIEGDHGYFDASPRSSENQARVAKINEFRPDVLLVGMGMPRQEHWISDNAQHLDVGVTLAVGGCLDYVAGAIPTPPRWSGHVGLEWLFRLWWEPRRLAYRYVVEPWLLAPTLLCELVRARSRMSRGVGQQQSSHPSPPPGRQPRLR